MARKQGFLGKVVTGTAVALCTLGVCALGATGLNAARDALDKHKLKDAEERVEEVLSAKELDLTTNWASSENIGFWSADNGGKAKYNDDAVSIRMNYAYVRYTEGGEKEYARMYLLPDLIERAVEEGATHISFKFTCSGDFHFWGSVYGADEPSLNLLGAQELPDGDTYFVDLKTLYDDVSGEYSIAWTSGGWWASGQYIEVSDVYFETVETMMEYALEDSSTNWASSIYSAAWSGTNLTFRGTTVKQSYTSANPTAAISVNGKLIAAAVAQGYTTAVIETQASWDHWFAVKNPNGGDALYKNATTLTKNEVTTVEIKLADLLNTTTGEYELNMTNGGWWSGCNWQINSLTFSTKIAEEESSSDESSSVTETTSSDSSLM